MDDFTNPADGLLYCGKCSTPKQCRVTIFGRTDIQSCICECERERLAAEKEAFDKRQSIAEKKRRENAEFVKNQEVNLVFETDSGERGRVTGTISTRGGKNK